MSAEPRETTNTDAWRQWESQVIDGVFPLRRFLGGSAHGAVFLTEHKAKNLSDAAIKLVPADAPHAEAQLAQWRTVATLSHPHLVRLFDSGRCQSGGREFLFVVMEYAEQTLAQILHQRALSPEEVRELLLPSLDTLGFLHRNHLVHGRLKPSNFLAVNDQLKLASDTVRPAGNSATGIARASAYDPPELTDRGLSTAGDIWGLGMTLVEALTQRTTPWPEERSATISLPANFPAPFVGIVRRCLSLTPADRPTVTELEAPYKPASAKPAPPPASPESSAGTLSNSQPPGRAALRAANPQEGPAKRRPLLPAIVAVLLIAVAVWVGLHFFWGSSPARLQPPAEPTPTPVTPTAIAPPAESDAVISTPTKSEESNATISTPAFRPPDQPSPPPVATSSPVLHEVTPEVPRKVREKIKGRVYVTVRVLVDPSGHVIGQLLENPGSSKYFSRLAEKAAGEWRFVPADKQRPRVWLVRFEFTRGGVAARATAV